MLRGKCIALIATRREKSSQSNENTLKTRKKKKQEKGEQIKTIIKWDFIATKWKTVVIFNKFKCQWTKNSYTLLAKPQINVTFGKKLGNI